MVDLMLGIVGHVHVASNLISSLFWEGVPIAVSPKVVRSSGEGQRGKLEAEDGDGLQKFRVSFQEILQTNRPNGSPTLRGTWKNFGETRREMGKCGLLEHKQQYL